MQVDNILDGFNFEGHISLLVRNVIELLRDPDLPFLEMFQVLSSLSGRIPAKLESNLIDVLNDVRVGTPPSSSVDKTLKTGIFPVDVLRRCIDEFLINSSFSDDEKIALSSTLSPISDILDMYSDGIKSHETMVLVEFLQRYYQIEIMFNRNSYEEVLLTLREGCRQDESPIFDSVISAARSFYNGDNRIELVLSILDQIRLSSTGNEMDISAYLPIVQKLTELNAASTAKVSLKAREFLLFFQMPNYEQRRGETFHVLNSAVRRVSGVDNVDPSFDYDNVIKLITANYAILDVLPAFFYHEKAGISAIAMYTYILHTSQAYTINSVRHVFSMDPIVFEWEFVLRSVYKTPSAEREFGSFVNLKNAAEEDAARRGGSSLRRGLMCAFKSLESLDGGFAGVMEIKSLKGEGDEATASVLYLCVDGSSSPLLGKDGTAREYFHGVVQRYKARLSVLGFKRVTFMVLLENHFPRYFTYQNEVDFNEDQVIRHIEPAMTYQLELHRLQEFDIEPIFIDNRRIHMYVASL
jgi:acetyl-CoA carboxylase/biotin carboxylase 1